MTSSVGRGRPAQVGNVAGIALALALLAALTLAVRGVQPAAASGSYYKCRFDQSITCGTVAVPVDPAVPAAGSISLRVYVAGRNHASHGTVLGLAGGPGQAAAVLIQGAPPQFAKYRVVAFDPRGVGRSTPISCSAPGIASIQSVADDAQVDNGIAQVRNCAKSLGSTSGRYRTWDNADDIEAVRASLGVDKLTLWGTSYGTTQALAYARRYPQHVDRLVLDSVEPLPIDFWQRLPIRSIPAILSMQCINHGCAKVSSHPVQDVVRVLTRLHGAAVTAAVQNDQGHPSRRSITMSQMVSLMYDADFDPVLRGALPGATAAAADGDWAPLLRLLPPRKDGTADPESFDGVSLAVNLATVCEDVAAPWPRATDTEAGRRAAFDAAVAGLPDNFYAPLPKWIAGLETDDQCIGWQQQPTAPSFDALPLPDVPTLIVGGDVDMRTPLAGDQQILDSQPHATLVRSHLSGHSVLGNSTCAGVKLDRFMRNRRLHRIERCTSDYGAFGQTQRRPPLRSSSLEPFAGMTGDAGRVATATRETIDDGVLQLLHALLSSASGSSIAPSTPADGSNPLVARAKAAIVGHRILIVPGLRSGRLEVRVEPFGFTFRNLAWVRDVHLDGNVVFALPVDTSALEKSKDPDAAAKAVKVSGVLDVRGPHGITGHLVASGSGYRWRWVGTIGGQKVTLPGSSATLLL